MAAKKELWLARDEHRRSSCLLYRTEPKFNDGKFVGIPCLGEVPIHIAADVGHGFCAPLTLGEAVDCRPRPESETDVAMAMLTRASERLPQGYRVGVDFGDRAGISVFGNGEVLKHDCDSFDIAVEIANDKAKSESEIPKLWAKRYATGNLYAYFCDSSSGTAMDESLLPDLPVLHKCRFCVDENGIRLIGTPERI